MTFVARAARVRERSYTTRHSDVLIVATTVVSFYNMFQNPTTVFSCLKFFFLISVCNFSFSRGLSSTLLDVE